MKTQKHLVAFLIIQFVLSLEHGNASEHLQFNKQLSEEPSDRLKVPINKKSSMKSIVFNFIKEKERPRGVTNSISPSTSPQQINEKVLPVVKRVAKKWSQKTKQRYHKSEADHAFQILTPIELTKNTSSQNSFPQSSFYSNPTIGDSVPTHSSEQLSTYKKTLSGIPAEFYNLPEDQDIRAIYTALPSEGVLPSFPLESVSQIPNPLSQIENEFNLMLEKSSEITQNPDIKGVLLRFLASRFEAITTQYHEVSKNCDARAALQTFLIRQLNATLKKYNYVADNSQSTVNLGRFLEENGLTPNLENSISLALEIGAAMSKKEEIVELSLKDKVEKFLGTARPQLSDKTRIEDCLLNFTDNPLFKAIVDQAIRQQNKIDGFSEENDQELLKYPRRLFWTNVWGLTSGFATDALNIVFTFFWNHYSLMLGMAATTISDGLATGYGYRLGSKIKNLLNSSRASSSQNQSTISFDEAGKGVILKAAKEVMDIYNQVEAHVTTRKSLYKNNLKLNKYLEIFLQTKRSIDKQISLIHRGGIIGKIIYVGSIVTKLGTSIINMIEWQGVFTRVLSASSFISSAFAKSIESVNQDARYANLMMLIANAYISLWNITDRLEYTDIACEEYCSSCEILSDLSSMSALPFWRGASVIPK